MDETQTRRREALVALAGEYWLDVERIVAIGTDPTGHFDQTADEDLFPYLAPTEPLEIASYCLVTKHEDHRYLIPVFDTLAQAFARAESYVDDDIFTEYPVEIIDLDSGTRWRPGSPAFSWQRVVRETA